MTWKMSVTQSEAALPVAHRGRRLSCLLALALLVAASTPAWSAEGQITWAVHVSLAPTWVDPAETPALLTPFMVLYALHDGLVKPMPGNAMAPGLAESWSSSKDGLSYTFLLRRGVRFHNSQPLTAEDVKFSFERYRGSGAKLFKERIAVVEAGDAQTVS